MTSSSCLSAMDCLGLLCAKNRLIKGCLFLSQYWKSVLNLKRNPSKCDVTPLQRSLGAYHLVRAAVGSIYRQDWLRNPWISGGTLLPPTGKDGVLCNAVIKGSCSFLCCSGINGTAFSVHMCQSASYSKRDVDTPCPEWRCSLAD